MKNQRKSTAIALIIFLFNGFVSKAQFFDDMSAGVNAGAYIYKGDLSQERLGSIRNMQPGISFFARKPLTSFVDARVQISVANIAGDDGRSSKPGTLQSRNFSFTTSIKEISAQFVWNILGKNTEQRSFLPYAFTGFGVSLLNVRKDYSRIDPSIYPASSRIYTDIALDNKIGSPNSLLTVPLGLGVELPISERLSLNFETSYRMVFSDYLDGFSHAASTKYNDNFYSNSGGVTYKLSGKNTAVSCPRF